MTLTPRQKLFGAALLAAALPLSAALSGGSVVGAARMLCGGLALAGFLAWFLRARGAAPGFRSTPRLKVVQRVGLSGRSGLVLVEIDGRPWLVAHGDGFARLRPVRAPRAVHARERSAERSPAGAISDVVPVATPARAPNVGAPPRRLAHMRLQDPLEEAYVASLIPEPTPSAPIATLVPAHVRAARRLATVGPSPVVAS